MRTSASRPLLPLAAALLGACSPAIAAREVAAPPAPSAAPAPLVDHHTHINSAAAARLDLEPMPTVALPVDVAGVLREYERLLGAGDAVGLARLFTEDGMILDTGRHAWMRGRVGVQFLYSGASGGYRYRPTAFAAHDSKAHVTGGIAVGALETPRDIAQFLMVRHRGQDGRWRIAAEMFHVGSPPPAAAFTADDLIRRLDSTAVQRAAVMSVAYRFDSPAYEVADVAAMVAAENDWVAAQIARYPGRLVGFCSAGP